VIDPASHLSSGLLILPPYFSNLSGWANNGVLLLNSCLTVREGEANSHSGKGWELFTDTVLDMIDKYGGANLPSHSGGGSSGIGRGVVFLAWGAYAEKRVLRLPKVSFLIQYQPPQVTTETPIPGQTSHPDERRE